MNQNSKTGWIIAGLLAIVLIIVLVMMWNGSHNKDLGNVLEEGRTNLIDVRAEIEKKCQGPEMNQKDCQAALDDLEDVLKDFKKDVNTATTSQAQ